MRPIIIGAGRGSRLEHRTEEIPKTMVEVMGRPMLDWILEALEGAGFSRRDVIFICGYAEEVVRARHPEFTFVRNERWEHNNILASLLCAREHLLDGFVSTYSDIVYDAAIVERLVESPGDLVLGCDVKWRRRYVDRSQHPETDAEKLRAEGGNVTELSRNIESEAAYGEFIGVMKASAAGGRQLVEAFDAAAARFGDGIFREGRTFEKAYLIDLLQHMLESGTVFHHADTPGSYMELDTLEDLAAAERWWRTRG
jgi:choline kinase